MKGNRPSALQAEGFFGIQLDLVQLGELLRVLLVKRSACDEEIEPNVCLHNYPDHPRAKGSASGSHTVFARNLSLTPNHSQALAAVLFADFAQLLLLLSSVKP